jgi:hypothetical protein
MERNEAGQPAIRYYKHAERNMRTRRKQLTVRALMRENQRARMRP